MTDVDREQVLQRRKALNLPWHNPPHFDFTVEKQYLISSSCYEHAHVIGKDPARMTECESEVITICHQFATRIYAWCILPNHYHVLLKTEAIKGLRDKLGEFHGRSSFIWNTVDGQRGRKVWHNCVERAMRSERHFWATLNYVHHNPVHHGYVKHWTDWPWSSASRYLESIGREKALHIWKQYPLLDYGKKWDI